jgi:hypothetical protein
MPSFFKMLRTVFGFSSFEGCRGIAVRRFSKNTIVCFVPSANVQPRCFNQRFNSLAVILVYNLHDPLPDILPVKQPYEGLRQILKSFDDILAILDLAFADPA